MEKTRDNTLPSKPPGKALLEPEFMTRLDQLDVMSLKLLAGKM